MASRILFDGVHLVVLGPIEDLHSFAKKVGLKREWFQENRKHQHYDVFGSKVQRVIAAGAEQVTNKEIMKALIEWHRGFIKEPSLAGQQYVPANGIEASMFKERWCDYCKLNKTEDGCQLLADEECPSKWIFDSDGQPTCTAFEVEE